MPASNPTKTAPIRLLSVCTQLPTFFRTHLGARLTVVFILVALIPMLLVALLSYQRARASLVNLALSRVEQEATLTSKDMDTYLGQFFTDILALSKVPPVQQQAAQLAQHDVELSPFVHRLECLAGQFEREHVLALIARYL